MKTTLFILCFLIFEGIGYSQVDTKIIQVDLSKPHKRSVTIFTDSSSTALDDSKWLSIKSREKASIKLVNGNPFKYTYKIDTKTIAFFNEKAETENSIKKAEEVAANKMSSSFVADSLISVKTIGKLNQGLNQSIDSLDIDVKFFYDVLIQKNTLDKADYIKRKNLRNRAELNLAKVFELLNDFEKQKPKVKTANLSVREDLLETKDKAIKSIEAIVKKLYTINEDSYTLPIDVEGKNVDVLEFKVRRFDKETKEEDLNFAPNAYNIWIKGGLKIDVSAGIFFTSLYDEEYDKRDDPAIPDNKIITLKNSGDYDMAFGTTINTYIRMNSWIVPTLNFGAVLTKSEKLQVLFGVGAILGKQERIIFSTGVSMGKVDRLANSYSDGGSYNLGTSGVAPTQSQFDFGHFFGVTYNLTKVKKISLDKGIEEN